MVLAIKGDKHVDLRGGMVVDLIETLDSKNIYVYFPSTCTYSRLRNRFEHVEH